ncbi:MAG: hypothetical protein B7Y39_11770 [Bdellovibrio sp. 28-41-41]|nr:MAG: hypothetical protein B7Y39_11770 [Bdellovibrio sp. 28-41-41]
MGNEGAVKFTNTLSLTAGLTGLSSINCGITPVLVSIPGYEKEIFFIEFEHSVSLLRIFLISFVRPFKVSVSEVNLVCFDKLSMAFVITGMEMPISTEVIRTDTIEKPEE